MKKVIVISTSLRPGSNSHALAEQFAKGAEATGQHNLCRRHRGGGGGGKIDSLR
jgi:hypothetical protein